MSPVKAALLWRDVEEIKSTEIKATLQKIGMLDSNPSSPFRDESVVGS